MSTLLVITRGLPASGKSTWARGWVGQDPRRARVNRDDLRAMIYAREQLPFAQEEVVTVAQRAAVEALLRTGHDVVVDDTHLRVKYARAWADLAARVDAHFEVRDFLDVPLEVCLERDAARLAAGGRGVGEALLRDLHARFVAPGHPPAITPSAPRGGRDEDGAGGVAPGDF